MKSEETVAVSSTAAPRLQASRFAYRYAWPHPRRASMAWPDRRLAVPARGQGN
jgi:hypothetical protein